MSFKPTSFDIAQRAGVSQPTVSRALRGHPSVSEGTRLRIEAIAAQLNYAVDRNASRLRSRTTNTLALLFFEDPTPDESHINPFFLPMLGSIARTCARHGYDLLTSFQQFSRSMHVDYEYSRKADGIMLLGYGDYETYRERLNQLEAEGARYVRWGSVSADAPGMTIGSDNRMGGLLAGQHLVSQGYRRIAFLGEASSHAPEAEDRWRGACDAMIAAGITPDPDLVVGAVTTDAAGYTAARELLARGKPFDAVFAACDLIAIGAMRAFEEAGLSIPDDIGLVGFDDIPLAGFSHPPLTTVAQDVIRGGAAMVEALIEQINGRPMDVRMLPPRLVVRQSTARPAGAG
ncbi:LacI family DNA-binding transcriptional regulator [Novosphingobium sp.]|uniref:LacI family DNA-binding transcriptional regulator n=1 Tax=Novosphingobium sp. TaxID=1874826 RepID=UPI0033419352